MGGIQQCCFEEKRYNRKNGLLRLTNRNKLIDNTSFLLRNYQKSKKKSPKEIDKNNNSDIQINGIITENNVISNKETQNKKNNNQTKSDNNEIDNTYKINKSNKKKKNKSSSVDCSNTIIRTNTFDLSKEKSKSSHNNNIFHKKYFIKGKFIGEGRFGQVYSGLCISSGDIITIKFYNKISDLQKNKIINNLDTLYKLNHKNIIKAIPITDGDNYDENGEFCILYESINSKNVEELIKNFGSLDEKIIQIYIKQLLEGLKYLHENKIYHKNLKPSNILVDSDGTIKISDYLVDNLILGDAQSIYNNYLKSDKIDYYIPPFFIHIINEYRENNNDMDTTDENNNNIFNDWQSYDLWFLGCLIIEVSSRKKPWSHYNFKNNQEFFDFLGSTNLVPTLPKKLSLQCQELVKILLNYSITKNPDVYDIIFNLDFFKSETNTFTYNNINNIVELKSSLNDVQCNIGQNEDSNISTSHNVMNESEMQLGQILANNKVVNILNGNNNDSFSVSYTCEDNLSFSQSFMNNKLNQSILSKGKNINNININRIKNIMPEVQEAQIEQSPDPVKDDKKNNFNFSNK